MAAAIAERLERYAELAVRVGANVAAGQRVHHRTHRARAAGAGVDARRLRAGARYVDVCYTDQHVRRAMIELGPDEALGHTPAWLVERWQAMAGNATIGTTATRSRSCSRTSPGERVGRARMTSSSRCSWRRWANAPSTGPSFPTRRRAGPSRSSESPTSMLWAGDRVRDPARRADPIAEWRAHAPLDYAGRRRAERASLRLFALPRAGHRFHGRPAPVVALGRGRSL